MSPDNQASAEEPARVTIAGGWHDGLSPEEQRDAARIALLWTLAREARDDRA
jgi:hypothetical protein